MRNFLFVLIILFSSKSHALTEVLTIDRLLLSLKDRFPLILALEQDIEVARGKQRQSLGEFDVEWKTKTRLVDPGYYHNRALESVIQKPTEYWGLNVYGGYRLGDGRFPVYEGKYETTNPGEVHAGFGLPLLRDREIDRRRASLQIAEMGINLASKQVELKKIEYVYKATEKYWLWVAYGLRMNIASDLLATAKDRISGLRERVKQGDVAEIELKDNERTVLQRESQLVKAKRAFQNASFELSLFYLDNDGVPIVPTEDQLPKRIDAAIFPKESFDSLLQVAKKNRPEFNLISLEKSQLQVENKLADNQLLPKLDLIMELSNDVGDGDRTREPTELESGIVLEIPLQRRKAEGELISNTAKIQKLDRQLEFITSRIKADILDSLSAIDNAKQQINIVRDELKFAREVELGERDRFKAGESTILIVNLRELATADTASKQVEAQAEYEIAQALLKAALGKSFE